MAICPYCVTDLEEYLAIIEAEIDWDSNGSANIECPSCNADILVFAEWSPTFYVRKKEGK